MPEQVHLEAIKRVLSAIYPKGETRLASFMFGRPGAPHWQKSFGTEVFAHRKDYIRAVLYIRQNGAPYLRAMSVSDLRSMVTSFVTNNFWYVCNGDFFHRCDSSYASHITDENKIALADALASSAMFRPERELTLFPLIPIRVESNFECDHFFVLNSTALSGEHLPERARALRLNSGQFPPFQDWDGKTRDVKSWLGVQSPLLPVSKKMAAAILGAIALTPIPRERHLFSGRTVFGGRCTVGGGYSVSLGGKPHTPPLANDIVLTDADTDWLEILAGLFANMDSETRKQLRALEYFYRAWFLDARERLPALCMSLDSLVGVEHGHTAAAVRFVKNVVDATIDEQRLRLLLRIRGAVVHGAAPDAYDSANYEKYYLDFEADPIRDMELVTAKCLREAIFSGKLPYHSDPHAEIVAKLQARGRLPRNLDEGCIIPENL